jgi:hypothetical protein
MSEWLKGKYDLHMHTAPDVVARKCTDLEAARRMRAASMAGGVIKNHFLDTAGRAAVLRELYPDLNIAGGIVLNRSVGGINPWAAQRSAEAGGQLLWFPTLDSRSWQRYHRNDWTSPLTEYLRILDGDGKLIPAVYEVLEVAEKYSLIVGTGHIGPDEGMALVTEGCRRGITMVLTHCDNPKDPFTPEEQAAAVKMGALVEHSYFTTYFGRTSAAEIAAQVRLVGAENVILSSDLGQTNAPYFDEGMEEYQKLLLQEGITGKELEIMLTETPKRLIG